VGFDIENYHYNQGIIEMPEKEKRKKGDEIELSK
jgi:hypothetical protein